MLRDKTTGDEIKVGDEVETFRGELVTITDIADLVYVVYPNGITTAGYYPSVINAEWCDK